MVSSFKTNAKHTKRLNNIESRSEKEDDPLDANLEGKLSLTKHKPKDVGESNSMNSKMMKINSTDLEKIDFASSFQGRDLSTFRLFLEENWQFYQSCELFGLKFVLMVRL